MAVFFENVYLDVSAIVISLLVVLIAYFKWAFTYWARRGVYTADPLIPFGNALNLFLRKKAFGVEFKDVYADIRRKGKKYGGYYAFGKPIFVPADLDLVKQIFTKDFVHFMNHIDYVNEDVDPLSGHLFSLKGLKWKNLRAKLTPTFTSGKMKMMFQTLVNCSEELVVVVDDTIEEKTPLDIKDVVGRFTTDVIGSCAFGIECNSLKNPDSEFRKYGKKIFEGSLHNTVVRLFQMCAPKLLDFFRIRVFKEDIANFLTNVVSQTVAFREENNVIRKDFMHLLIQLKNNVKITENEIGVLRNNSEDKETASKTNGLLSLNELVAQTFVFFAAGFETSSTTTTFCLYELVQIPEYQNKVREEINMVLEKYGGKLTYDGIMEMTYMEKCINETLRKYPPVPVHSRECTQTYKVPGSDVVLEKGSFTFIPVMGIHYDPEYYPDPEKFDPERFSNENKAARHSAAWTPFGDGPRLCIGLRFGVMQTKVALAILLKNYKFSLNPKTEVPLKMDPKSFILSAESGIWLNTERVSSTQQKNI